MDQHSRWQEAMPLKSLTAKVISEAFKDIFVRTGITHLIAIDNGTNFVSKLAQEFFKRLGVFLSFQLEVILNHTNW